MHVVLSWGVGIDARCIACGFHTEDVLHVLRDCEPAMGICKQLISRNSWDEFFYMSLTDWLSSNLDMRKHERRSVVVFPTAAWRIWTKLCNAIFQPDEVCGSDYALVSNIVLTSREILAAWGKPVSGLQTAKLIDWTHTPEQIVKLNTDGASRANPGIDGAGGVIRDSMGRCLLGFQANLGVTSNLAAELHPLRLELLLPCDEGYRQVICEMDALVMLDLVLSGDISMHPLRALISDIREILAREWSSTSKDTFL